MAEPKANPSGFGRKPTDGPGTRRAQIDEQQRQALARTKNRALSGGPNKNGGFKTPRQSRT